jgi:hypothetical protein
MESESTQSRLAAFSEAWLASHPKGKTKELARAWRLEQLRRTRASIPTVIGRGGATLGALPADVYGLIAAQDEGALRALRSASRRTRTSTAALVKETYCLNVTAKELRSFIGKDLAARRYNRFSIGRYPLDARGELVGGARLLRTSTTVYRGSTEFYELFPLLDHPTRLRRQAELSYEVRDEVSDDDDEDVTTRTVTLSVTRDSVGQHGRPRSILKLLTGEYGYALSRGEETVISVQLLKRLLEAKLPCVNEDRAKGLDFVRRRLEAIVRSQAERLLGRLGTTLEKVLGGEGDELVRLNVGKEPERTQVAGNAQLLLYWCVASQLGPFDVRDLVIRQNGTMPAEWLQYAVPASLVLLRGFFTSDGGLDRLFADRTSSSLRMSRQNGPR